MGVAFPSVVSWARVTPPCFCKQLHQATTDNIEVRLCGREGIANEDTPVELNETYIN